MDEEIIFLKVKPEELFEIFSVQEKQKEILGFEGERGKRPDYFYVALLDGDDPLLKMPANKMSMTLLGMAENKFDNFNLVFGGNKMSDSIPVEQWEWDGFPKHFICADKCQFHLATKIGNWVVSTLGAMVSDGKYETENPDGVQYMEIGSNRFFETMVFEAKEANCGCCDWESETCEQRTDLPINGCYKTSSEARKGHMEICKYISENQ